MRGPLLLSALPRDGSGRAFLGLVAACALVVPVLNLLAPPSSPLHVSTYVLTLIGKYLCYAILAVAVDLVWGFCGILSLVSAAAIADYTNKDISGEHHLPDHSDVGHVPA